MADETKKSREAANDDFVRQAEESDPGFFAELRDFVIHGKKWWLAPILVVLLLLGLVMLLSGSAIAPFIYPLF